MFLHALKATFHEWVGDYPDDWLTRIHQSSTSSMSLTCWEVFFGKRDGWKDLYTMEEFQQKQRTLRALVRLRCLIWLFLCPPLAIYTMVRHQSENDTFFLCPLMFIPLSAIGTLLLWMPGFFFAGIYLCLFNGFQLVHHKVD